MDNRLTGNVRHLVITGLVGFLYSLIGQLLYPILVERLWQPLGIALYFLGFAIVVYATMFVLNQVRGDYSFWLAHGKRDDYAKAYRLGVVCVVAVFLLSGVFEVIYELGGSQRNPATSYIFLIDDSGSMSGNDPEMRRAEAIGTIMSRESSSLPYAVYGFTGDAVLLKDMAPYSASDSFSFNSDGGTDILTSLDTVLDDIASGRIQGGTDPRILLLSDGSSSHFGWRRVAQNSRGHNVSVSTIGFGYDSGLLRNIAERTGGVYVQVDNIEDLPTQMETAIASSASRNLISSRAMTNHDTLYMLMRVGFLSLVGVVWSLMKYETYFSAHAGRNERVFVLSVALCTFASILMEILFQQFWTSPAVVRIVFCVLWALTPGYFMKEKPATVPSSSGLGSSRGSGATAGTATGNTLMGESASQQMVRALEGPSHNDRPDSLSEDEPFSDSSWNVPSYSGGDSEDSIWG